MKKTILAAALLCCTMLSCKKNNLPAGDEVAGSSPDAGVTVCKGKRIFGVYCLDVYRPVCGCDGVTYSNSCYAYIAGVKSYTEGACDGGGGTTRK